MEPESDDPRIPESLRADLATLYARQPSASPNIEQAILSRARAHLAGRGRLRPLLRVGGAAAAVAAIVLVSVAVLHRPDRPQIASRNAPAGDAYTQTGDANHDGVVDIRDAMLLARKVDAGQVAWTRWEDANGDKVIDRKDVDAIAMLAVKLDDQRGAVR
jgi:hypothetical protein